MAVHDLGKVDGFEAGLSLEAHGVTEPELDAPVLRVRGLTVPHEILSVLSCQAGGHQASVGSPCHVASEDRLHTVEERTLPSTCREAPSFNKTKPFLENLPISPRSKTFTLSMPASSVMS